MTHLLVIGSPSLDTIHIDGQTFNTVGGAGMYVAMAAKWSGVNVSLFGPRPDEIPDVMQAFASRLDEWIGPEVPLDKIPHFEITHFGDKAEYSKSSVDSELNVDFGLFPDDLSMYDAVHITAMGDPEVQKAFYEKCQSQGARLISMGTWLGNIKDKLQIAKFLVEKSNIFFMNEEEALFLFGSLDAVNARTGQTFFITQAEKGALVIQGDYRTQVPGVKAEIKDPTGAGESFCGSALANILLNTHPVMAAMQAARTAAEKISDVSANALMRDTHPSSIPLDRRVRINPYQVKEVSAVVQNLPDADPFSFVGDHLPPVDNPYALDYFFAVTLQQFGFWTTIDGYYHKPLIADIDGVARKGSVYMYYAFMRPLKNDPDFYSPQRQAEITLDEFGDIFRADDGSIQMPALKMHLQQANQYGRDMLALGLTPRTMIEKAMQSPTPLKTFLMMLDHIGGYKEDPIRKKSNLLALSLTQRPEAFLEFGEDEAVKPVVDYHCMRSILRTGLVEVLDFDLRKKIAQRQLLQPDEEWAVRFAGYHIQKQVEERSGKPIGAVDWFFFNYMRSHCPEMTDPECSDCALNDICSKRKKLFQPVIRTTFY